MIVLLSLLGMVIFNVIVWALLFTLIDYLFFGGYIVRVLTRIMKAALEAYRTR
jgi:hypothetical protein